MPQYTSLLADEVQNVIKNKAAVKYFPSPIAWEDQVLYFLLVDRFSNNQERGYKDINNVKVSQGTISSFQLIDNGNAVQSQENSEQWCASGSKWCGGNLKGLQSKIGYLKRLGITAVWISPIFKQIPSTTGEETYHGYGIQNFIDIDPHFGTRQDLKNLVVEAHKHGIYVIMDIILNHAGNVFSYNYPHMYWYNSQEFAVKGFNDEQGNPTIKFETPVADEFYNKAAIWPREFQSSQTFTRQGEIRHWDNDPEYYDGDFFNLKDITLGYGHIPHYQVGEALRNLIEVYKFWISYADIDGFRIDTVKHMDKGATRFFASAIHEYAQSIGKERFYLIGEITGGREHAFKTMEETGLDAALGINEIPGKLEGLVKGYTEPKEYFDLFRHSLQFGKDSHTWFRNKVVTMFDDHDQVRKGDYKARFCADNDGDKLILAALTLNLLTEGIPCIYYGTEQFFDGHGGNDRFIRECMFGGSFGAFRSQGKHFFNEDNKLFKEIGKIIDIRNNHITLRRGRQYLRKISGNGFHFDYPQKFSERMKSIIAWSRIFNNQEIVVAINTDANHSKNAWITVDNYIHQVGERLSCIYISDSVFEQGTEVEAKNGKAIQVIVPPGGVVIMAKTDS